MRQIKSLLYIFLSVLLVFNAFNCMQKKVDKNDLYQIDTLSAEIQIDTTLKQVDTSNKLKLSLREFKNYPIAEGDYIEIVNDGTILDSLIINVNNVTLVATNLIAVDKPVLNKYPSRIIIDGKNKTFVGVTVNGNNVRLINFGIKNCLQVGLKWMGANGYAGNVEISDIGFRYVGTSDSILFINQSGARIFGEGTIFNSVKITNTAFDALGIGVSNVQVLNCTFTKIAVAGHSNGDGIQLYENVFPPDGQFTLVNSYIELLNPIKHCLLGHDRKITAMNNYLIGGSTGIIAGKNSLLLNNNISNQQTNLFTKVVGRGIILMDLNLVCKGNTITNDEVGILVRTNGNKPELVADNIFINCSYNVKYKK